MKIGQVVQFSASSDGLWDLCVSGFESVQVHALTNQFGPEGRPVSNDRLGLLCAPNPVAYATQVRLTCRR